MAIAELERVASLSERVLDEVERAVIGKREVLELVLMGFLADGHVLLEDYPGRSPYQSGLYFHTSSLENARAKPVLTAFRFPFVAYLGKKTVSVWGRNTTSTKTLVTVQLAHHRGGPWRTVAAFRTNASGIFQANLKLKATKKDWLRAIAPLSSKSLAFSLTVPHAPHIGPWGN